MAPTPTPADPLPDDDRLTAADADGKRTVISLGELVDLALCTPEPGAVNFNLLRSVLHALVQRLDLVDIKAEILDEDTDRVFSQIMDNAEKLGLKDVPPRNMPERVESSERRYRKESSERRSRHRENRERSRSGGARRSSPPPDTARDGRDGRDGRDARDRERSPSDSRRESPPRKERKERDRREERDRRDERDRREERDRRDERDRKEERDRRKEKDRERRDSPPGKGRREESEGREQRDKERSPSESRRSSPPPKASPERSEATDRREDESPAEKPADRGSQEKPADTKQDVASRPSSGSHDESAAGAGGTSRDEPRRSASSSSPGYHSDEYDDLKGKRCPPDSAGEPDVTGSGHRSAEDAPQPDDRDGRRSDRDDRSRERDDRSTDRDDRKSDRDDRRSDRDDRRTDRDERRSERRSERRHERRRERRPDSARRSASAEGASDRGHKDEEDRERRDGDRAEPQRPAQAATASYSSGLSSGGSEADTRRRSGRRSLSELAEERLRRSGRQSAVSIGSAGGAAVLADYTSLDRLERKLADVEQKLNTMELADMLPKLQELQKAVTGSQEDVQGLWQSLQLMKKVDANEEGIDKLTGVIEQTMAKLKKVRKHTDKLDKQLAELLGRSEEEHGEKPGVTLSAMQQKYNEIKNIIDGLMGETTQAPTAGASADDGAAMRSVGAGIVTWNVLETTLHDLIKTDLREMEEVNEQALSEVEQQQTGAIQQGLMDEANAGKAQHATNVKRLLGSLGKLVEKHRILEKRVGQMETALGDNFSDKVLEQLNLLKASASQIQELKNKLSSSAVEPRRPLSEKPASGWSDQESTDDIGRLVTDDISVNLSSIREPSQMDLNHLTDWLNYNKARMEQLEKALVSQSEQVRDFGDRLGDQVVSFRDKLERVERELAAMLGKVSAAANKSGMTREDSSALHDAYAKIQTLQMDVESLSSLSKKLVTERGQIEEELSMLIRALEELKECKVDRATLDELIETKADRSSVEKKVSNWQFEQACQELSEGLGAMLEKMTTQEADWVRSVDEINADLHRKLDRVELAPVRRYINSRLKNIMTKLNRLITEDESPDACVTRRKLLKNLNCVSCDDPKRITGLTAAPIVPRLQAFPPSLGDRHQTSFRMGDIRRNQQMRCEPYKDMTTHPGAFRSHMRQEIDYMTHRGIPHHNSCPLYNNKVPHGRCTCVATRFCGGSHTKINCLDTRMRRVGLGAPLLSFGGPRQKAAASKTASKEQVAKSSSAGARRSSSRPTMPPPPGGAAPRQTHSLGSSLRRRGSAGAATAGSASAPEVAHPPPPPPPPSEAGAGEQEPAAVSQEAEKQEEVKQEEMKQEEVVEVKEEVKEEEVKQEVEVKQEEVEAKQEEQQHEAEAAGDAAEPAAAPAEPGAEPGEAAPEEAAADSQQEPPAEANVEDAAAPAAEAAAEPEKTDAEEAAPAEAES